MQGGTNHTKFAAPDPNWRPGDGPDDEGYNTLSESQARDAEGPPAEDGPDEDGFRGKRPWNAFRTYIDAMGEERSDRRKHDRGEPVEKVEELFNGFHNLIANLDENPYLKGYTQAMMKSFAEIARSLPPPPQATREPYRDVPTRPGAADLFSTWWSMLKAHRECAGLEPMHPDDLIFHFMGSGASCMVFVKDVEAVIESLKVAERCHIPADDGRPLESGG